MMSVDRRAMSEEIGSESARLSCLSVRHFLTGVPPSRDTRVNDDQSEEMNESDEVMGESDLSTETRIRPWNRRP